MCINKFYNQFKNIIKYNKYNKYNNRYIYYDIEKNKSYYVCTSCNGSKLIKCFDCQKDIKTKKIRCDNCIICNYCDSNGLNYYFTV